MAWTAYRNLRQEAKKEIKIAERDFFIEQIQIRPGNTNNIWKAIRHIIPKKCTPRGIFSSTKLLETDSISFLFQLAKLLLTNPVIGYNECNITLNRHYFVLTQHPLIVRAVSVEY